MVPNDLPVQVSGLPPLQPAAPGLKAGQRIAGAAMTATSAYKIIDHQL